LAWKIEVEESARRALEKLDRQTARRITRFLHERVAPAEDPRSLGKPLRGRLANFWRYRVGDHRIVCDIHDDVLRVLVLQIGHRKDVYR